MNELEGLCRSRLAAESRAALGFLREKNPQIRYVTSKGAPLPNFAACTMNEENDDQVTSSIILAPHCCTLILKKKLSYELLVYNTKKYNIKISSQGLTNDDRILQCCLSLIKDKPVDAEDTCPGRKLLISFVVC